ncbi:MAG: discoidin domain-containing protein [Planctomycetes bacterium]|nr:discoidin domain-containing protein [Planctomycetota bacterium]
MNRQKVVGWLQIGLAAIGMMMASKAVCPQVAAVEGRHWPPPGLLHPPDLVRQGPAVGVAAECDGVPVYGYGSAWIYGVSPDFAPGARLQEGNASPVRKIQPKKSWEIEDNRIGATPPRMPRTARSNFNPFLGIHLLDGDAESYWCSRGHNRPEVEPAWARVDLAQETAVRSILIVPRKDKQWFPRHLTIRVSRDGWHWVTVYDNPNYALPPEGGAQEFAFSLQPVKQVWIIGQDLPLYQGLHAFSMAEVAVNAENGENAALVSRGAGVTVSSTEWYIGSQRETHEMLWPVHYDLGTKWVRINYAGSVLNWRIVERVKGQYEIDPVANAAVTQAVENGCRIIFGLGFTNWLYTPEGHANPKEEKQLFWYNEMSGTFPKADAPDMLKGFKNFVRVMVNHFKDRVDYWEIWNEQSGGYGGWHDVPGAVYTQYVKEVSPLIKELDPGSKVVMGSLSGLGPGRKVGLDWLKARLEEGIGPHIDAIAWHGYYGCDPDSKEWQGYRADVAEAKAMALAHGFRGEYMHSEWCIFAPYPKDMTGLPWITEKVKAKHMARFAIMNLGLEVMFFWNETWCDGHIDRDVGLFRNTFSADPQSPSQPQPAYYVLRTLCTVFENARPAQLAVEFTHRERQFECWTFSLPNGNRLVSVSSTGNSQDNSPDYPTDISFPGAAFSRAVGIDVLNGKEQDLVVSSGGGSTILRGMLVKDYPIVVRLSNP